MGLDRYCCIGWGLKRVSICDTRMWMEGAGPERPHFGRAIPRPEGSGFCRSLANARLARTPYMS
jgi:hypothetical protein